MMYTLITGASSGIGRATAIKLAHEGRDLILIARRLEKLHELKEELSDTDVKIEVHKLDVTDRAATETLFASFHDKKIGAVINNAGLARGKDPLGEASPDDLQEMIDINISAFVRIAQLSVPHLKKTKGHIVNLGSIAGKEVYTNGATYCGTKHFVGAINKGLRIDLNGTGIRVTEIAPGAVETEFSTVRFHGDQEKADNVYKGYDPLVAEDIAECISFALSRPAHVNIESMLVMPTAQASATIVAKK